jgi:hypothetical protein
VVQFFCADITKQLIRQQNALSHIFMFAFGNLEFKKKLEEPKFENNSMFCNLNVGRRKNLGQLKIGKTQINNNYFMFNSLYVFLA